MTRRIAKKILRKDGAAISRWGFDRHMRRYVGWPGYTKGQLDAAGRSMNRTSRLYGAGGKWWPGRRRRQ